jgi:hypothetical protein
LGVSCFLPHGTPVKWVEPAAFGIEAITSADASMGVTALHFTHVGRDAGLRGGAGSVA